MFKNWYKSYRLCSIKPTNFFLMLKTSTFGAYTARTELLLVWQGAIGHMAKQRIEYKFVSAARKTRKLRTFRRLVLSISVQNQHEASMSSSWSVSTASNSLKAIDSFDFPFSVWWQSSGRGKKNVQCMPTFRLPNTIQAKVNYYYYLEKQFFLKRHFSCAKGGILTWL